MKASILAGLIMTLTIAYASSCVAAEANCNMGDHGSDAGPCTDVERSRVDKVFTLVESSGQIDQSLWKVPNFATITLGAYATLRDMGHPCAAISFAALLPDQSIMFSCDHKTHIYWLHWMDGHMQIDNLSSAAANQ